MTKVHYFHQLILHLQYYQTKLIATLGAQIIADLFLQHLLMGYRQKVRSKVHLAHLGRDWHQKQGLVYL